MVVIKMCLLMMKEMDYIHPLTIGITGHLSIMGSLGAMVGQIIFGIMGDRVSSSSSSSSSSNR